MRKKLSASLLALTLIASMPVSLQATEKQSIESITVSQNHTNIIVSGSEINADDSVEYVVHNLSIGRNEGITVYVATDIGGITEEQLMDLAMRNELRGGEHVIIHSVGYKDKDTTINPDDNSEARILFSYQTTTTGVGRSYIMQDTFLTSVARGMITTLSRTFSETVNARVTSGNLWVAAAELSGSVTSTVNVQRQFFGPPENSPHNTREFRVRFEGTPFGWRQTRTNNLTGNSEVRTGAVTIPQRYTIYSIDRTV